MMGTPPLWLTLFQICIQILDLPSLCIVLCVILVSIKQFSKRFFLVTFFFHFKIVEFIKFPLVGGSGNWIKSLIGKKNAQIKDQVSLNFWVCLCFCSFFFGGFDLVPSICFKGGWW